MGWRGAHREDEGGTMSDISRRNLLKGAAVSAVSISAMGLLGACAAPSEPKAETTTDPSADGTGTGSGTNSEYMAEEIDPATEKPEPPAVEEHESDINLISGANGEIYETSDMYPSFIKKAQEEGNNKAVQVFTRAKLAEAYHAKLYMDAYTTIDTPFDGKYYLCPICGYIHKGENFTACPICLAPKSSFTAY